MLNEQRSLDDWYKVINKMYLDRNYYRQSESVFAHLVEIVGGLSLLASGKKKAGVNPQVYITKALAWWMALCGKVRIRSVENMLWSKFPYVCPYCRKFPHNERECRTKKQQRGSPDWDALSKLAQQNKGKKPKHLGGWLTMFNSIYEITQVEEYTTIFARFSEELGELSEATRLFQLAPGYFFSEASDFFAWLMHLQGLYLAKSNNVESDEAKLLDRAMWKQYPGRCADCGNELCTCPPVLKKTCGRIAHEMPLLASEEGSDAILEFDEAMDIFELSSKTISVGDKKLQVNTELIEDILSTLGDLKNEITKLSSFTGENTVTVVTLVSQVQTLARVQRVTQESIDQLAEAIARLPSEPRSSVLQFLAGLSSSVWAMALVDAVKALIGS